MAQLYGTLLRSLELRYAAGVNDCKKLLNGDEDLDAIGLFGAIDRATACSDLQT